MKRPIPFVTAMALFLLCLPLFGQQIPPGQELIRAEAMRQQGFERKGEGSFQLLGDETDTYRLTVERQPKQIYQLSQRIPLRKEKVKRGQVLLLSFEARTEAASLETGEAKVLWRFRQADGHRNNIQRTSSIGSDWRTFYIPVELTDAVVAAEFSLSLQFGYPPQQLLLRKLSLLAFGPEVNLEDLPRTRIEYHGRDLQAPWRQEALARIERIRKGAVSLQFTDEGGQPIPDLPVAIRQVRQHFQWGAAVNANRIVEEAAYRDAVSEYFNTVVFENDLKIKAWQQPAKVAQTMKAIDLMNAANIEVKGHVLIWPGFKYLSPAIRSARDNPEKVSRLMDDHLEDVLGRTMGRIGTWDVVNEAYSNRDLQTITGSEEILQRGFTELAQSDPAARRFVNEFGIISRGGHDERKQKWYYDYIKRMDDATGGLVDGIGIQCHMGADLTPPERVLELLDYYAELGKEISISEFTIDLDDPETRFDYTRDFLIAAYSHPSVSSFLFWGFYAPTHPKASILDENWAPADMGSAYVALTQELWTSQLTAATDAGGRVQGRVYFGEYAYSYVHEGKEYQGTFSVLPEQPAIISVAIK